MVIPRGGMCRITTNLILNAKNQRIYSIFCEIVMCMSVIPVLGCVSLKCLALSRQAETDQLQRNISVIN